ncbi:MAG: glycosyltransferase family 2 protein [Burkholderiaceae bacterium]
MREIALYDAKNELNGPRRRHAPSSFERDCRRLEARYDPTKPIPARFMRTAPTPTRTQRLQLRISQAAGTSRNIGRLIVGAWRVYRQQGMPGVRTRIAAFCRAWLAPGGRASHMGRRSYATHRNDYAEWVRRYDQRDAGWRRQAALSIEAMRTRPTISLLMPVFDPAPEFLRAAIESVRAQIYPHWELCIADDCSTDPAVGVLLRRYADEDSRIKVVFRERNGHIAHASNSALELVTSEFVGLLDHDDLLPEHALYAVAKTIVANPDAGLIFSDEDKIDVDGVRSSPYFKCDWNLELFRSQNMISHFGVYRSSLVRQVGAFRPGFEGSQDYDLALRCIETLAPPQIVHIPRVLYHWRIHSQSTSQGDQAKPYAATAAQRALTEHMARIGLAGLVESLPFGFRVHYPLPTKLPKVAIVIPTYNRHDLLKQCVESVLEKTDYANIELIVVDNDSDEPASLAYLETLRRDSRVRVLVDRRPFNFSALNNGAVSQTDAEFVVLLNNDTEVIDGGWLGEMVGVACQPDVGAVGARLLYPDDRIQHAGIVMGPLTLAGHVHRFLPKDAYGYFGRARLRQDISAVTAACLLVRRSLYERVGGLDEVNLTVAFNDVDFCLRLQELGYRNVYTPFAQLYHHESATRGTDASSGKRQRFQREVDYMRYRWQEVIRRDPAYSPNLTLDDEDFSLAWPPRLAPFF